MIISIHRHRKWQKLFALSISLLLFVKTTGYTETPPLSARSSNKFAAKKKFFRRNKRALKIRKIRVVKKEIFDTSIPSENKFYHRWTNAAHISTKEKAIRQQLLFKEGDIYDPRIAKETERAIRNILRLRSVKVTPIPVNRKTVDVLVQTQETWTTEPTISVTGTGDDLSGRAGIRERNLFGYGKNASYFYKKSGDIISRSLSYDDPAFLNTRLRLDGNYEDSEEGTAQSLDLKKPFYSSVTPWATNIFGSRDKLQIRLYENGKEKERLDKDVKEIASSIGFSLKSTTHLIRRVRIGHRYKDEKIFAQTNPPSTLKSKRYHFFSTGISIAKVDFLTVSHIDQYDRDEDFEMGPSFKLISGFSRKKWVPRSQNANSYTVSFNSGKSFGPSHFTKITFDGGGLYENSDWKGTKTRFDIHYFNNFQPRQTFAWHFQSENIINPEAEDQLILGGDSGLRGYQLNQFTGNKLLLTNFENRFFIVDDILQFASLGTAAFFDAGYVWKKGESIKYKDIKLNFGAGLRFHLTRTSLGHVLRLDVAYALKEVKGKDRLIITFGSDQAF